MLNQTGPIQLQLMPNQTGFSFTPSYFGSIISDQDALHPYAGLLVCLISSTLLENSKKYFMLIH